MSKIKFYKVFALLFLIVQLSQAQKVSITEQKFITHKDAGDKLFENEEYFLAAQEYHKAELLKPTDHYTLWQLAESYRLYQDYDDAEIWYGKLGAQQDHAYPLSLFWLGIMQKVQGKYVDAESTLQSFSKNFRPKTPEDQIKLNEADLEYKGCIYALEQLKKPLKDHKVTLLPAPLNSKATDYAPMIFFHDTSIVITSARSNGKGTEMNLATGEAKSDNFRFEKKGNTWYRHNNEDNFDVVNTPKDDGAGELSKDKSKYYYTICDPECGIFVSKKVNGKFTKPQKLNKNINSKGYWNAQPTLSPTADTLFFVSKRPGGKGQHDIWMSTNKDITGANEDWLPAINMTNINTPYVEISPFWDDHTNTIYFASNGHVGFGGWDIYSAKGMKRDSIVNLGLPFNSSRDDFYFTLGKEKGYLVSNREGGIGKDDIYSFDIQAKESVVGSIPRDSFVDAQSITSVGRIILGDNQLPVANLSVYLKNENAEIIKETRTNNNGEFRFDNLQPDQNFKIVLNENDPRLKTQIDYQIEKKSTLIVPSAAMLNNGEEYAGSIIVIDKNSQKPIPNIAVVIKNNKGMTVKNLKSDKNGKAFVSGLPASFTYKASLVNPNSEITLTQNFKKEGGKSADNKLISSSLDAKNPENNSEQTKTNLESPQTIITTISPIDTSTPATVKTQPLVSKSTGVAENIERKPSAIVADPQIKDPANSATEIIPTPAGTKPKIIIDHFKIKSSNVKPSTVFFENIYFDFNENNLSPSAKKAMDNLIVYYGNNKEIQIDIKSYSDGFGKPAYNKQLAIERGQACYDYLASRGVDQTTLVLSAVGEGSPVANNNSFAGRQLNRRVEFNIIGATEKYEPEAMAYIMEPKSTIYSIAKNFGMSVAELREMNGGIDPADIKAYAVLRVKRPLNASNIAPQSIQYVNSGIQEYKFVNNQFVPDVKNQVFDETISDENMYVVQPQETLFSIAKKNGITVESLAELNNVSNNTILIGQKLRLK